jgi:D-glycero-D-manno-heptose 1,7-bisphosphate phosphatase
VTAPRTAAMALLPATAFLDRDGTINRKPPDGSYVAEPGQLELLPGAGVGIRRLNQAGIKVIVVTNQRGVARGLLAETTLREVHDRMRCLLEADNAQVDRIYSCVHEVGTCACRKPEPGLLLKAMEDDSTIARSPFVMIGDSDTDVLAGARAGAATVRLSTTPLAEQEATRASHVARTLGEAVDWVLGR